MPADQLCLPGLFGPPAPVAPATPREHPAPAKGRSARSRKEEEGERFVLPFEPTPEILAELGRQPAGEILGLTLWRPWHHCLLIAPPAEGKRVENRPWWPKRYFGPMRSGIATGFHGPGALWIAIHAGKTLDEDAVYDIKAMPAKHRGPMLNGYHLHPGWPSLIVGVARVARVLDVEALGHGHPEVLRHGPWISGPFAWEVADVAAFRHGWQVPCGGAQGLWTLPADVLRDVQLRWAAARLERPV